MTSYNLHRQILSQRDLNAFLSSISFERIECFLLALNESVKGAERGSSNEESDHKLVNWLLAVLKAAEDLIGSFPPQNRNADVNRFGNVAFRDWLFSVQDELIPELMNSCPVPTSPELEGYFINSLGSSQRIDYGTGHELHFLVFLLGLEAREEEYADLVLKVFSGYLKLMRALQKMYWLEPAGSHGVWGLDDYHFLPFLFGSAQLCGHENIRPRAVHSAEMVHYLAPKYIYFDSILNILEIKVRNDNPSCSVTADLPRTNALRWMSPLLDDISAVKTWDKVNSGLIKMWKVEVMSKLPIMQHLLFGDSILPFKRTDPPSEADGDKSNEEEEEEEEDRINHYVHSVRGDCCGNPLPSIYANGGGESSGTQPGLPFD